MNAPANGGAAAATHDERRRHRRRPKPFLVSFEVEGHSAGPAYGFDISRGGVGILSLAHTPEGPFPLRIMLEEREFVVTALRRRENEHLRDGRTTYVAGLSFESISEEDAAFVERLVAGLNERENHVLSGLEGTFGGPDTPEPESVTNRRETPRKRKAFYIAYTVNDVLFLAAYGLDIGRDGMRILTEPRMPERFGVRVILEGRDFMVRVKRCWDHELLHHDKPHWLTGCAFTEIASIDREFIRCYVSGEPFIERSKLLDALERLRSEPDQAHLLLPRALLDEVLHRLVRLGRLAVLRPHTHPLVRYHYEGAKELDGKAMHLMRVESRIFDDGALHRFSTHFAFDEAGESVRVV